MPHYVDANIQILDQWVYDRFVELYESNIEYAGIKLVMTGCNCIYEHSYDKSMSGLEHDYVAINQCKQLFDLGFPFKFGLNENNIIFRIHTDRMKKVDEEWWDWIVNFSSRDQFSYMYCLWKYKVPLNYFLPAGEDSRNSNHFKLVDHDTNDNVKKVKFLRKSFFERLRIKAKSFNRKKNLEEWIKIIKSPNPERKLYVNGVFVIIKNIPNFIIFALKCTK